MQNEYRITIVARHKPGDTDINYASPSASAYYRSVPDIESIHVDLKRLTYKRFNEITLNEDSCGVKLIEIVEYFESPPEQHRGCHSDIESFRVLKHSELPSGVEFGISYRTWSINPPVYLAWLESQLLDRGVQFVRCNLKSPLDACSRIEADVLINCSGTGFSDPKAYFVRGN